MSKIDQKHIQNLQKFSDALENIVILLQEQNKNSGKAGATDSVNTMLGGLDTERITKIVEDLEAINNRTKKIESNTDQILAEVRDIKKSKDNTSGIFSAKDVKNKNAIASGVSSIVMIAGAIMAIGLAFKVVGDVDFLTVIGLSVSLFILAKTFSSIADIKNMDKTKMIQTGFILLSITGVILAAALILSATPSLTAMQLLSVAAIGFAVGFATLGILAGLGEFDPSKMWIVGVIPLLIPAVAMGIATAGMIFNSMPAVGIMKLIGAILISISLVPIIYAFSLIVRHLKDVKPATMALAAATIPLMAATIVGAAFAYTLIPNVGADKILTAIGIGISLIPIALAFAMVAWGIKGLSDKQIMFAAAAIPLIAITLVVASWAFQMLSPVKDMWGVIKTSLAIGLSVLFLTPAFILLAKSKLTLNGLLYGALAVVVISGAIMVASWILSVGNYTKYPSAKWAAGVGLSLLAFSLPVVALGWMLLLSGGSGFIALGFGILGTLMVAATIMATSWILSVGNYNKYPSPKWAAGVGLSLLAFSAPLILLGLLGPAGIGIIFFGALNLAEIALAIVATSWILSTGNYNKYPSEAWATGVGKILAIFGDGMASLPDIDTDGVIDFVTTIIQTAALLHKYAKIFDQPNSKWIDGLNAVSTSFNNLPDTSKANGINAIVTSMSKLSAIGNINTDPIIKLTAAISDLSRSMSELNTDGVEKLSKLSGSVMVLSLVDKIKLDDVIKTLNDKKSDLSMVLDLNQTNNTNRPANSLNNITSNGGLSSNTQKSKVDEVSEEQLKVLRDISRKLDDLNNKYDKLSSADKVGL